MAEPTMGEMARWTFYQRFIAEHVRDTDPRHVEAWMRVAHPTLDGLSRSEFLARDVRGARAGPGRRTRRVRGPGGLVRSVDRRKETPP